MSNDSQQESFDELKAKLFGGNADTEQGASLQEMAKKLFGDAGLNDDSNDMIDKTAQTMVDEFNGMLSQVTFGILLQMVTPEQQEAIKNQLYTSWKTRMVESASENTGKDSGLSELFGVSDLIKKSIDKADENIKDFLDLHDAK